MDELDIFEDTLNEDTVLGSSLKSGQAEGTEQTTYFVITSNAKGAANNPFTGDTARVVQMTEQELRQVYKDSGQIQDHFGTFDNYMTYIGESQEWIQSAEWMNASMEYNPSDRKWLHQMNEDVMWKPGEREELERQIGYDQANAKQSEYIGWLNAGAELLEKWGLNDKRVIYNSDGDQFKWTGSGYQKTIKVDDHASFSDYASAILKSVVVSVVTGAIAGQVLGAINSGTSTSSVADAIKSVLPDFLKPATTTLAGTSGGLGPAASATLDAFINAVATGITNGSIIGGTAGGISIEDQINAIFDSSNVIVNLAGMSFGDDGLPTGPGADDSDDDPMEGVWWYDYLNQIFRPEDYEDDADRLERQAAANRWIDAVRAYENGEITLDELKAVDVSILADIPGWADYYGKVIDGTGSESDTAAEQLEKDSAEPEQKEKDPAEANKDSDGETEKDKDATETEKDKDATEAEKDKDAAAEPEEKEKDDIAEAEKDKDADAQAEAEEKEKDTAEAVKDGGQKGDRNEWRYSFCQSGFEKPDGQGGYVCVSMEELGEVEDKDSEYRGKESASEQARKDSEIAEQAEKDVNAGEQQEKDQSETDKDDTAAEELEKDTAENVANNAGINKDAEDSALADTTKDGGGGDGDGDGDGSGDGSDQTGDPGEDQNASVESKDQGETTIKDGEPQNDINEPVNKDGEGFADVLNLKDGGSDSGGDGGGDGEGDILNLFKGFGIGAAASGGFTPPKATDFNYRLDFNPQKISSPILEGQDYLANLERFDGPEQQLDRIIKRNGMLT